MDATVEPAAPAVPDWLRERLRSVAVSTLAVLLGLILGGGLLAAAGANPLDAYRALLRGALGSPYAVSQTLVQVVPLLIIGLGLAIAFRARMWNIGAEGQFYIGAMAGGLVAIYVPIGIPVLLVPVAFAAAMIGGGLWASLVGLLRARWGVNEVVTSLLLNYPAIFFFSYLVRIPFRDPEGHIIQSERLPEAAQLGTVPGLRVHVGILIALALIPVVAYVIRRTPFGFRVGLLGLNPEAARAAGVDTRRTIVQVLVISGALAGLAGIIQVMGVQIVLNSAISRQFGFTAIIVALLGRLKPVGVLLAAIFIGGLNAGGVTMQQAADLPSAVVLAIQALFVLLLLAADRVVRR